MTSPDEFIPHKHIDTKLLLRLGIFFAIALVILSIVVYDVFAGYLSFLAAGFGALAGAGVGYVLGRILTVKWHKEKRKAVMEMDVAGFLVIGIYIVFRLAEHWFLGHWFSGVALSTLSLAVLGGALLGRFLGLRVSILKLVEENADTESA